NLGTVPAGGTATVTVVVRIPPGTPNRLPLINSASVASSTPGANAATSAAAVTDTVVAPTTVGVFDPTSATWYLRRRRARWVRGPDPARGRGVRAGAVGGAGRPGRDAGRGSPGPADGGAARDGSPGRPDGRECRRQPGRPDGRPARQRQPP